MNKEQSELEIIQNFIDDTDVNNKMKEITEILLPNNIFEIVGMGEQEIKHSNFLGWLFELKVDGHGYVFLKYFLDECLNKHENSKLKEYFDKLKKDDTTIKAYREWRNPLHPNSPVDLVVEDSKHEVLIVIENKINAGEDTGANGKDGQLTRYKNAIQDNETWKLWKNEDKYFYFFLSPDGRLPSEELWKEIDYSVVAKALETIIKDNRLKEDSGLYELMVKHYLDLLYRKGITMNNQVKALCDDFWKNHANALEILIKNRSGMMDSMAEVKKYINEKLEMKEHHWISYQSQAKTDYYICLPSWLHFYNLEEKFGKDEKENIVSEIKSNRIGLGIYFTKTYIQIWIQPLNNKKENEDVYTKIKKAFQKTKIETKETVALKNFEEKKYMYSHGEENFGMLNLEKLQKEIVSALVKIDECFKNNPLDNE